MTIPHFFVTRFGIGVHNLAWLSERVHLLRTTVLPSLQAQTEKNFRWLIAIGNDMPLPAQTLLRAAIGGDPRIEVVEVDHLRNGLLPRQRLREEFLRHGRLFTTRIDDDDALHLRAVEELQEAAFRHIQSGDGAAVIYHPFGYELQMKNMCALPLVLHGPSMGLSVVSDTRNMMDAYSLHHMRTREVEKDRGIQRYTLAPERHSWLYVRHALGDSALGGEGQMSDQPAIPLTEEVMRKLEADFGIRSKEFLDVISGMKALKPRSLGKKDTLLNERLRAMENLKDVLLQMDRQDASEWSEELKQSEQKLRSEYLRLSEAVFSD